MGSTSGSGVSIPIEDFGAEFRQLYQKRKEGLFNTLWVSNKISVMYASDSELKELEGFVNEARNIIEILLSSITDVTIDNGLANSLKIFIIDKRHIWIELDIEERYKSIVYGRNKSNVKCFIRILANLSAKRDKLAAFFM